MGESPTFNPHETEAVWELEKHRYIYIVEKPEHAGHSILTYMVDDLKTFVEEILNRGIEPISKEDFPNEVCKITFEDPDGNQIGIAGKKY